MSVILQLNQDELRAEIKNCLIDTIEELKKLPTPEPLPDRIELAEACELTGYQKSAIYKLTMLGEIPFQKYGKRLVFSRKALNEWMKQRTVSPADIMSDRLARSAKRQLQK